MATIFPVFAAVWCWATGTICLPSNPIMLPATTQSLISILLSQGPYGLFKMASSEFGYQQLDDGYAGKCHLCVDIRHHVFRSGQFSELRPHQFYQEFH